MFWFIMGGLGLFVLYKTYNKRETRRVQPRNVSKVVAVQKAADQKREYANSLFTSSAKAVGISPTEMAANKRRSNMLNSASSQVARDSSVYSTARTVGLQSTLKSGGRRDNVLAWNAAKTPYFRRSMFSKIGKPDLLKYANVSGFRRKQMTVMI